MNRGIVLSFDRIGGKLDISAFLVETKEGEELTEAIERMGIPSNTSEEIVFKIEDLNDLIENLENVIEKLRLIQAKIIRSS